MKATKIYQKLVTEQFGGFSKWCLKITGAPEIRHLAGEKLKTILRQLNSPELGYNIVGIIVALACGGVQPLFAIMFSEILGKLLNL